MRLEIGNGYHNDRKAVFKLLQCRTLKLPLINIC